MNLCALSPAFIAESAAHALREELETYPKPGLVSFVDCGSHPDMCADDFLASIAAITPTFARMAEAAEHATLTDLQRIGLDAEAAMFAATKGRNTHRGAIFCLGLLVAAAGRRHLEDNASLGEIVHRRWGPDIPTVHELPETSDGIRLCHRYHLGGVRQEAALGFPTVYRHGLLAWRAVRAQDRSAARVQTFFALLQHCEDTTLLKRGGREGLDFAHHEARRFLAGETTALAIHQEFVRRNLTAGGAADLLAATLFIDEIERQP